MLHAAGSGTFFLPMRTSTFFCTAVLAVLLSACGGEASQHHAAIIPGPQDRVQAAFDSINALIVADPAKAQLYADRARLFIGIDSMRPAQRDLEWAVKLDSNNVVRHLDLGDLYYSTTQVDQAQAQFQRAAELDPKNTQALLKLAEIQLVLRNYGKSMDLVNKVIGLDEHAGHAYFLKGWIHMETGDTTLALSSFRTAVEQDNKDYGTYIMLGKLSAAQHDPLAEQYYTTAISLRPRSVEAWYNKGMYEQENGKDSMALESYAQIMRIDSSNALAWYNSGYVKLEHLHDPEGAKRDFSKAIQLEPGYADAWYNRGLAMERIDQLDSAAANYEIVMGMRPDYAPAAAGLDRLQAQGVRIKIREKKGAGE